MPSWHGYSGFMSTPSEHGGETPLDEDPSPEENDGDPTLEEDVEGSPLDDPASENQFGGSSQELQGDDPASGGS